MPFAACNTLSAARSLLVASARAPIGRFVVLNAMACCMAPAADVLEYLWWINSHSRVMYNILYGDKDTFSLAFAAAGGSAPCNQTT
jgi:hypothetical protein